jgi:hypothetical protein
MNNVATHSSLLLLKDLFQRDKCFVLSLPIGLNIDLIFKLISPLRPGLIEAGDGSGFIYLIMPIRLNG